MMWQWLYSLDSSEVCNQYEKVWWAQKRKGQCEIPQRKVESKTPCLCSAGIKDMKGEGLM